METDQPKPINVLQPSCSDREIEAVTNVLKSRWWGMGPVTAQFERRFAEATGRKHAIALNSATAGLHLAVRCLNDRGGGNIVCPALTFVSTAMAGLYEELEVRLADIDEATLCMDPDHAKTLIDDYTVAVIPVHYAGRTAPTNYGWASVIEDCAHAAGSTTAGKTGELAVWSFHPVKNLATGDGGMITTDSDEHADRIRKMRWCGISLSTWDREKKGYNWEYAIDEIGFKYHPNDINSALGLVQLDRLGEMNDRREEIAIRYGQELGDLPLRLPPISETNHLYAVRMEACKRNDFLDYMKAQRIAVGVHYKPLHHYPIFWQGLDHKLPVTDRVWQQLASLPIHPELTDEDQTRVIEQTRRFFGR